MHANAESISLDDLLEQHRTELTAFCRRMLGPSEAEDAVQESFLRAWRSFDRFEGRSSLRFWLYRIAANVCVDMLEARKRRAVPIDLGPAGESIGEEAHASGTITSSVHPLEGLVAADASAEEGAIVRESTRLAFARLQHLPLRQRAALILCKVLRWRASEVAELLETSVPSVNSALQRARANLRKIEARASARTAN
jgi:RNA polymerase sigma-70 factor, ECF subfamily